MFKRLIPIFFVLFLIIAMSSTAFAAVISPFLDLDENHQNYEAIVALYENNVIEGYEDLTFKAENNVNRAEFLKILIEGSGTVIDPEQYNNCFPDVTNQWFAKYVCYAKEMNWIQGYPDGEFKPENQIYHVEAIKMLIEAHGYADELVPNENPDILWYVPYLDLANKKGFIAHQEDLNFPLAYQTRADVAEMIYRSMMVKKYSVDSFLDYVGEEVVLLKPRTSTISRVESDEIYIGNLYAPVIMYEYSDYQCPFCKRLYDDSFAQLKADYIDTGKVLYIVKDFPLGMHPRAEDAALAAHCANDQEAFWEMRDLIYTNQSEWINSDDLAQTFSDYSDSLNLNTTQFDSCMENKLHMDEINADYAEGIGAGVTGTPVMIINGEKLMGAQPYESVTEFIDGMLSAPVTP